MLKRIKAGIEAFLNFSICTSKFFAQMCNGSPDWSETRTFPRVETRDYLVLNSAANKNFAA